MDNKSRLIYAKQVFACRRCVFLSMLILFRSRQTITQREASREEWSTRAAMCVCMYACVGKHGCVDTGMHVWIIERSLEVKLPTIWTNGKQRWEESEKRREERRSQKRKSQKKEDPGARKGRKVGKVHAVVARGAFASEKAKNSSRSEHFLKLRCRKSAQRCGTSKSKCTKHTMFGPLLEVAMSNRKSARRYGAKHISKSKCTKHTMFGPLLEVAMSKKCTAWREAHFEVKMLKTPLARTTFGRSDVVSRGRRTGLCTLSKVSKTWGFCGISKNDGRRGTFEEDLQRCIFRGRHSTRDMFIRAVRRSGRWFPESGCILEHQIFRFAEVILRDRCSTSYDPVSLFRGRRSSLDRLSKNRKTDWHRAVSSALNFPFLKEISPNCFVFDVVNSKKLGSLAELLRFWCRQVQKLRKSRWIAAFLVPVKFKNWGCLAE